MAFDGAARRVSAGGHVYPIILAGFLQLLFSECSQHHGVSNPIVREQLRVQQGWQHALTESVAVVTASSRQCCWRNRLVNADEQVVNDSTDWQWPVRRHQHATQKPTLSACECRLQHRAYIVRTVA